MVNLKVLIVCGSLLILPAIKKAIDVNQGKVVGVDTKLDHISINRNIRKKNVNFLVLEVGEKDSIYQVISAVQKEHPLIKIVIIASNCVIIQKIIKIEMISAIITINEAVDELVEAIFLAKYDQIYYSPKTNEISAQITRPNLTPRERETLSLLKEGLSKKQIAKILKVNIDTVRTHTRNLNAKLETQF